MKAPRRTALFRTLLPSFKGFHAFQKMLVQDPVLDLLSAFHFDDSTYDTNWIRVRSLVLPLYIPTRFLHFGFSVVLGGPNKTWDLQIPGAVEGLREAMLSQGMSFLQRFQSPTDLAAGAAVHTKAPESLHVMEAVAYSFAVSGKWPEAIEALVRFLKRLEKVQEHNESTLDMKQRAELLQMLIASNPEQALAQLRTWREQTLTNLKLSQ